MRRTFPLLLAVLLGCNAESMESVTADAAASAPQQERSAAAGSAAATPARMIIRNAKISIVVGDATEVLRTITELVESSGGFVAETNQWKEREQVRASATLRVPAAQLTPTLAKIRELAIRTERESVTAQDVSQEFSDLAAQLRNLRATETELLELLRTVRERTQKAADVLEVHRELVKVRGEIEHIQGRQQYLSQMSALSTIELQLIPDVLAAPVVEPGWQPVATVKAASRSLINSLELVIDALIWVVLYLLPLGLVFVLLALLVRALWRRVRRRPRVEHPTE